MSLKCSRTENNKNIISMIIMIMIILISSAVCSFAYSDLDVADEYYEDIMLLTDKGLVSGYPDGSFRPKGAVTRAEFVRMINQIFEFSDKTITNMFSDVKEGDWYYDEVLISLKEGYLVGYPDGTFRPQGNITREEVCAILDRILKLSSDIEESSLKEIKISDTVSPWANDSVRRVVFAGLMHLDENGQFQATKQASRSDIAAANATIVRQKEKSENHDGIGGGGGNLETTLADAVINTKNILDSKIIEGSTLSDVQKSIVKDMSLALGSFLKDGDEDGLISRGKAIKTEYDRLPIKDRDAIEQEIRKRVPISYLYVIRDYLF